MTEARAKLLRPLRTLRRRWELATLVIAAVDLFVIGAVVLTAIRVLQPLRRFSPSQVVALLAALGLVGVVLFLLERHSRHRSRAFLAKQIDLANQLNDHFITALDLPDPTKDAFEEACLRSLDARLAQKSLVLPAVPIGGRPWLLAPAVLLLGVVGIRDYRERHRLADDGKTVVKLAPELAARADQIGKLANNKVLSADLVQQATETRKLLARLAARTATKENVLAEIGRQQAEIEALANREEGLLDAALQLGEPASQRAADVVAAMKRGDQAALSRALNVIADALARGTPPPLTLTERAELGAILETLAQTARSSSLSAELRAAGNEIRRPPAADGTPSPATEKLAGDFPRELGRAVASKQLLRSLRSALAQVERPNALLANARISGPLDGGLAKVAGSGHGGGELGDGVDDDGADVGGGGDAVGGAAAGGAVEPAWQGGSPERADTRIDARVAGQWSGAPARQLVAASSTDRPGARDAYRMRLEIARRDLEEAVRREEIPAEYAQAIRSYFSGLKRGPESEWKSNK